MTNKQIIDYTPAQARELASNLIADADEMHGQLENMAASAKALLSLADQIEAVGAGGVQRLSPQQSAQPVGLQTCNCRWDGETRVQQCTLHQAWEDNQRDQADELRHFRAATQPVEAQPEQIDALDDLVTLVRRLVHAIHKVAPQHDLTTQALDYLQRKGFGKGPLRSASAVLMHGIKPAGSEAQPVEVQRVALTVGEFISMMHSEGIAMDDIKTAFAIKALVEAAHGIKPASSEGGAA